MRMHSAVWGAIFYPSGVERQPYNNERASQLFRFSVRKEHKILKYINIQTRRWLLYPLSQTMQEPNQIQIQITSRLALSQNFGMCLITLYFEHPQLGQHFSCLVVLRRVYIYIPTPSALINLTICFELFGNLISFV